MRVKCFLAATLVAVLSWVLFAGVAGTTPTQEEFDEIVDREMFKYMHGWDYRDAVNYWKKRGVTDEMFGKAYVKIARRTVNEPVGYDHKCSKAIDGIAEFCTGEMLLTNLVYLADKCLVDEVRADAIRVLSTKVTVEKFTTFAERVVASTNLGVRAGSKLMSCLSEVYPRAKKLDPALQQRILQVVRRHLEVGGKGALIADRVLVNYDEQYRNSDFRKRVARMMLDPLRSPLNGNKCVDRYRVEKEYIDVLKGASK